MPDRQNTAPDRRTPARPRDRAAEPADLVGRSMTRDAGDAGRSVSIADFLREAQRAASAHVRNTDGGRLDSFVSIPIPPAATMRLGLDAGIAPVTNVRAIGPILGAHERMRAAGAGTRAATDALTAPRGVHVENLGNLVRANSALLALGAQLVALPEISSMPVGTSTPNGATAMLEYPARFGVIDAAAFATVPDDDDVTLSELPTAWAEIRRDDLPTHGLHFKLTRRDMHLRGVGVVAAEIGQAIAGALGKLIDRVALDALAAAAPLAGPSPAAIAAAGLNWPELRAVIGTAGEGARTDPQGCLYAGAADGTWQIPAILTDQAAGTFAGAWNRIGVALADDVRMTATRLNFSGDLDVVVWANAGPLLPDPAKFFDFTPDPV